TPGADTLFCTSLNCLFSVDYTGVSVERAAWDALRHPNNRRRTGRGVQECGFRSSAGFSMARFLVPFDAGLLLREIATPKGSRPREAIRRLASGSGWNKKGRSTRD